MYIEGLFIIQLLIFAAGKIFKMEYKLVPEMILILTFIVVFMNR